MAYHRRRKASKANLPSLFLVLAMTSLSTVLVGLVMIEAQKPLYVSLPEMLIVPVVHADIEVPDTYQVVSAVVPKLLVTHLNIPKIGVEAVVKDMGVTPEGAMAVPDNRVDVGWYSLGTRPGETGSAVIGGHSRWDAGAGVFARLNELKKGDVLSVMDAKGVTVSFVVRDMRTYDATDTNTGIFHSESGQHLNLITCSGSWDPAINTYTTRLVVFTDVVQAVDTLAAAPKYVAL